MSTAVVKDAYQTAAVAGAYDAERFSDAVGRLFDRLEKRALEQVLTKALGRDRTARVLDAPCGTGRITEMLLGMGFEVLGGDISPAMMRVAADKTRRYERQVAFQQLDLEGLDLPSDSFDVVTCVRLMHHLDSAGRAGVLKELARVSREWVLINVSYSSGFYRLRRTLKRWLGQGVSRQSSTWAEVLEETRAAGLKVRGWKFAVRWLSEDLALLLEKVQ